MKKEPTITDNGLLSMKDSLLLLRKLQGIGRLLPVYPNHKDTLPETYLRQGKSLAGQDESLAEQRKYEDRQG